MQIGAGREVRPRSRPAPHRHFDRSAEGAERRNLARARARYLRSAGLRPASVDMTRWSRQALARSRPLPRRHGRAWPTAVRFGFSTRALPQWARPPPPPCCHPGLVPGPREAGRGRCLWPPDRCPGQAWAPEQVRGDKGGTRKAGESVPQSVSRSGGCAGNPPVPTPCTRSSPSKPDSNGFLPAFHAAHRGRCPDQIRARGLGDLRRRGIRSLLPPHS